MAKRINKTTILEMLRAGDKYEYIAAVIGCNVKTVGVVAKANEIKRARTTEEMNDLTVKAKALRDSGVKIRLIAEMLGVSPSSLNTILYARRIVRVKSVPAKKDLIAKLLNRGAACKDVAEQCDCALSTVYRYREILKKKAA